MKSRMIQEEKSRATPTSDLEILAKLERNLQIASQSVRSPLAKYVFDESNRELFGPLIQEKQPDKLVAELNEMKITNDHFQQIKRTISNKNDFKYLFDLPASTWFDILLRETIEEKDLIGLFGAEYGAVVGILEVIEEFENPFTKALTFYYLTHSRFSLEQNLVFFLKSLNLPENSVESFADSFRRLHFIIVNRRPALEKSGGSGNAAEVILGIKPDKNPDVNEYNQKRVKSIIRLITECVEHLYRKYASQLDSAATRYLIEQQDSILANQAYLESVHGTNPTEYDRGDAPVIDAPPEFKDEEEQAYQADDLTLDEKLIIRAMARQMVRSFMDDMKRQNETRSDQARTPAPMDEDEIIHVNIDGVDREYRFRR